MGAKTILSRTIKNKFKNFEVSVEAKKLKLFIIFVLYINDIIIYLISNYY